MGAPEPEEIYRRTRTEGARRLERPLLELVSTALAAGFDILAGVLVLCLLESQLERHFGSHAGHVAGSLGFGIGFVFLVVGRGELFTENFLVPLAGLDGKERNAWRKLAEGFYANGWLALFVSAVFAGALITAMTWFVEGQEQMLVRIVVAWAAGAFLALGGFNHVIVATIELIVGLRFGAHVPVRFVVENFFLAAGGNLVGGIGLVTLNRFTQARSGTGGGRRSA